MTKHKQTKSCGKGFGERNLWKYRQFYLTYKRQKNLPTVLADSKNTKKGPTLSVQFNSLQKSQTLSGFFKSSQKVQTVSAQFNIFQKKFSCQGILDNCFRRQKLPNTIL